MLKGRFFIFNETDRPEEKLIVDNRINSYVDKDKKYNYILDDFSHASSLDDFGFRVCSNSDDTEHFFIKVKPSIVKYSNGDTREWQGSNVFLLDTAFGEIFVLSDEMLDIIKRSCND